MRSLAALRRLGMTGLLNPTPPLRSLRLIFSAAILLACFPLGQARASVVVRQGDIVVVPVQGEISPSLALFIRRAEKLAENSAASALILDMNTYGGQLDAAEEITGILNHAQIPTYTFIDTNAGSAGAIIALATKHIYMAPVSAIGAAAPILSTGQDLPPTEKEKAISYWSALVRGSALRNGHNPDIGQAFMDKDEEVKIGNKVVHAKGTLLTLNAQEATEKFAGKSLLAEGVANTIDDVVRAAGLKNAIVRIEPSGFEQLAFWLTTLAPLLLLGGIIGAYLEFKIPGFGLAGILSAICFALFFLGHYFAGLAGWEVVGLFVLGVFFVLVEVLFFAHSTIVFGVVGILLILGSLLWAMIDRYPGDRFFPSGGMLKVPVLNLFLTLIAAALLISFLAKYLPRTNLYRRIVLSTVNPPGPSLGEPVRAFASATPIASGMRGRSLTILRPSGKAQFDDRVVDVVTEGEFIAPQTPLTVIATDGMRVVVREVVA